MFPDSFVWGAATSAYQIEGGRNEMGKGQSIWDTFSDEGRLSDPGDEACDSFHLWERDLDLLAEMGADAYRFSVAWTRVIPDGDGEVNEAGLDFYRQMVDGMKRRGIAPYLTLYHWDLPQALQDRGGWVERSTVDAFVRYAGIVSRALGRDVKHWITQNEPWVAAMLGYLEGVFAPGVSDWPSAIAAGHHLLLSHGRAVEAIRDEVDSATVGIALDCRPTRPATGKDHDAARHFDGFRNRWFFDPVFGKGYPDDIMRTYVDRSRFPSDLIASGDMDEIAAPIDFLGLNYYTTVAVHSGADEIEAEDAEPTARPTAGFTEMGWEIDPDGLADYLIHIADTYAPASILVTENGASYSDGPDEKGLIDDRRRIAYLSRHVAAVETAREAGVPVDGYFVWSLLDNIEWVLGFNQRFGLVWVDQETFERLPKRSFDWYRQLIANRQLPDAPEASGLMSVRLETWMDGYVAAWVSNHPDDIEKLFTEDAVYDPQTAEGEIHGLEAIIDWWLDIDDQPDNWDFEWTPLIETDDMAIITGSTKYSDPPASYRNLFVLKFDEAGLCRDFTEWYIEED
jgi:beta-glucosidase